MALALVIGMAMAGCASAGRSDVLALPPGTSIGDGQDLLIVTVDNEDPAGPPRPATTRPGYLGATYASSAAARAAMRDLAREYDLVEIAAWPIQPLKVHCAVLRIAPGSSREELVGRLSQDKRVRLAQAMHSFTPRTQRYNDPYVELQRGFRSIDAASAQQWSRGEKVRVAVVDTGLDAARCNSLTLAQALTAAIEEHAQVVNLSFTGPRDPLLNSLVAVGIERGILYVGAAPFDDPAEGFPGGAPGVIPVDMSEAVRVRDGVLRAPGREVVTLVPGGSYDFVTGPSLATAHVSGAVALLVARNRGIDREAVYGLLSRSELREAEARGTSPINACVALASLLGRASCPPPESPAGSASATAVTH